MKLRRLFSLLIGFALIGLMVWKLIAVDKDAIPVYIDNIEGLPDFLSMDVINMSIFYTLFGLKVLMILMFSMGGKKALVFGLVLMPIFVGEIYYTEKPVLEFLYNLIKALGFGTVAENLGATLYLYLGALAALAIYWLVLLIIVAAGKTRTIGSKITLLLFGLIPMACYYINVLVVVEASYSFEQWQEIGILATYGVPFVISLMLIISQKGRKKQRGKNVWFAAIETL
jgi:hypothetical protein